MAYVQGSLGEKISKTMDDAAALFKQGDYQQSIDMFARTWDLLPDSKYSYDESYLIVWHFDCSAQGKRHCGYEALGQTHFLG